MKSKDYAKGSCPVCNSSSLVLFLERPRMPVQQHQVIRNLDSALNAIRGNMELAVCEDCGFIFNQSFEPEKLGYETDYDNTQTCSPFFRGYVDDLVKYLIFEKGVRNSRVLEVGCGKGEFLKLLVEGEPLGNTGIGFDPSYTGASVLHEGRLRFHRQYYGAAESDKLSADVVICRHVLEHVHKPMVFLRLIKEPLNNTSEGKVFIETPCAAWILKNLVVWDFFYEHCSYFSEGSLRCAMENAGFVVDGMKHVFGGQYLWLEGKNSFRYPKMTKGVGNLPTLAMQYAKKEKVLLQRLQEKIQSVSKNQRIALWGAGAKGVTFLNLMDPHREWIDCVVDMNPNKQECFVPGTGHPVIGHGGLEKRGVQVAIIMNPNYRDEIGTLLRQNHLDIKLMSLEQKDEVFN